LSEREPTIGDVLAAIGKVQTDLTTLQGEVAGLRGDTTTLQGGLADLN